MTWMKQTLCGPTSSANSPDGLQEGQALDISDGAPDFRDDHVRLGVVGE